MPKTYVILKGLVLQLKVGHCPFPPRTLDLRVYGWSHLANGNEAQKYNVELQIVLGDSIKILLKVSNDNLELKEVASELLLF